MIVVRLCGGLGNQFFQYAFSRHLADTHRTELWLNASFYWPETPERGRQFELPHFNIRYDRIITDDSLDNEATIRSKGLTYVKEDIHDVSRWYEIVRQGDNLVLDGYWVAHNDFLFEKEMQSRLGIELAIKSNSAHAQFEHFKKIIEEAENSVAVHVRRGDYCYLQQIFPLLDESYYKRAFDVIERTIPAPQYFVFSDEIELVKRNFPFSRFVTFVQAETNVLDFELMRRCRHAIIANSTYSWWAAYLIAGTEKMIVAPVKWYNDRILQAVYESTAIVPRTWNRV
jgi:hypothetical protein